MPFLRLFLLFFYSAVANIQGQPLLNYESGQYSGSTRNYSVSFNQAVQKYLLKSSQWTFFLSIVGVGTITITMLILVFGFIDSTFMESTVGNPTEPSFGAGTLGFLLFLYLLIIGLPT